MKRALAPPTIHEIVASRIGRTGYIVHAREGSGSRVDRPRHYRGHRSHRGHSYGTCGPQIAAATAVRTARGDGSRMVHAVMAPAVHMASAQHAQRRARVRCRRRRRSAARRRRHARRCSCGRRAFCRAPAEAAAAASTAAGSAAAGWLLLLLPSAAAIAPSRHRVIAPSHRRSSHRRPRHRSKRPWRRSSCPPWIACDPRGLSSLGARTPAGPCGTTATAWRRSIHKSPNSSEMMSDDSDKLGRAGNRRKNLRTSKKGASKGGGAAVG